MRFIIYFFAVILLSAHAAHSQDGRHPGTLVLDQLLSEAAYPQAKDTLDGTVAALQSKQAYYDLTDYIYYTGKIHLELHSQSIATSRVKALVATITEATDSSKVLRQVHLELATYWELIGDSQKAYDDNLVALKHTFQWKEATGEDFGLVENNLGTLAARKGDLAKGLAHHRKALQYYEAYPKTQRTKLYILYNSLGGSMWFVSKIDSALYFYNKAEKTLKLLDSNPMNSFYRPAILQNNIAGIYASQGNLDQALSAMRNTIDHLSEFLASDAPDAKKESAKEFLFQAIENYAGIYKDMGDYGKAKDLIEYAYQQKQKTFAPDNPELFKSKVLLGQIHLALKDYKNAQRYLDAGLSQINQTEGGNAFWAADAHYYKACANDALGHMEVARHHFQEAERYYELALQGAYDELYLDFINNASHFYAKTQQKDKALQMAQKAYDYIRKNQGSTTSFEIQQALNLGKIHYEMNDYARALEHGTSAMALLHKKLPTNTRPMDSMQAVFLKPEAILLQAQAAYRLQSPKDQAFLEQTFNSLKKAISLVEHHKTMVGDDSNVSILIDNHAKLFEFTKHVALDLYLLSKDEVYIDALISLHESFLYNRIRSRLNARSSMVYAHIPDAVLQQEAALQRALQDALDKGDGMETFFKANAQWEDHLAFLKTEYPKYYNLRFASISKSLDDLTAKVPAHTTIIRYFFVDDALYALVLGQKTKQLVPLDFQSIKSDLAAMGHFQGDLATTSASLHRLYQHLWQPFADTIRTSRVVIIPDRELFNLSFEMLTPVGIKSYKELATNSLLSKHVISYNYSLFLVKKHSQPVGYDADFVAFVPEFDDQMKAQYKIAIQDSIDLDRTYLTLLPQPFTKTLAHKSARLFDGESFLNERSTERIFKHSAKEHKIIHIGTHAESNNVSPELSRLVFAKSTDRSDLNDDYLHTYEIYNLNLSSNLAILTACETGKPSYQAGEGMISLAHAFNYAGSESMLTSLWKIDEQSSADIIGKFYENITQGMPKDEALQQAKLAYLGEAEGRTINPDYWAGLVLIGDTAPIPLTTSNRWVYWLLGGVGFVLLMIFLYRHPPIPKT